MKNTNILIRVTCQDKERWTALAKERGMNLSEYIRSLMEFECRRAELKAELTKKESEDTS